MKMGLHKGVTKQSTKRRRQKPVFSKKKSESTIEGSSTVRT